MLVLYDVFLKLALYKTLSTWLLPTSLVELTVNTSRTGIVAFCPWRDLKLHDRGATVSRGNVELKAQVAHGLNFGADTILLRRFQFLPAVGSY